jgi:single-strand DNA-binding protein
MLIGHLGADPEARYTAGGQAIATLRIATSYRQRDPNGNLIDETEWHRIVAWERLAELAQTYLHKGSQIYIEGRLQTRQWTDQSGQNRYTTEIVASDITLLGGSGQRDEHDDWEMEPPQLPQPQPQPQRTPTHEEPDAVPF